MELVLLIITPEWNPIEPSMMKFPDLLMSAIQRSEIPLRFEPGAEEAVAQPVVELLRAWILAHEPQLPQSEFEYGQKALVVQLIAELDGMTEVPG